MTNPELNAAIATRIMGWTQIDRRMMGWGEGPVVWSTGNARNPTWQWFSPATDLADARMAARKAGVKVASTEPAEICRVLLEGSNGTTDY